MTGMRWDRLGVFAIGRPSSMLRRLAAAVRGRLSVRARRAKVIDAHALIMIMTSCPPEFLIEVTTQQVVEADERSISMFYRPPSSFTDTIELVSRMTPEEETMPRRLMLMVHELHRRGYERLRAALGLSPSGCYWRFGVTPASNISVSHGALHCDSEPIARYTTGQGAHCFGWADAAGDSPGRLAVKFLERFAELSEEGRCLDRGRRSRAWRSLPCQARSSGGGRNGPPGASGRGCPGWGPGSSDGPGR